MITQKEELNTNFEIISAYIDNECSKEEEMYFLKEISSNKEFKFLYETEKALKIKIQKHFKQNIPSENLVKSILSSIEKETKNRKSLIVKHKYYSLLTKILFPIAAMLVLFLGYYIYSNYYNSKNDFVIQSGKVYKLVNNNEIKLQYLTSNTFELSELLNKSVNFGVFIPEVKDAVLIGGSVNNMNGLNVVHFVHKRKDEIIYTLQVSKNDIINKDNFILHKNHKQEILNGQNWIACEHTDNDCAVIWFQNDVICSSVSCIEANEMANILTNYK